MNGWIARLLRLLANPRRVFGLRRLLIELSGLLDVVLGAAAIASLFLPALRAQLGPLQGWQDWQLLALGAVLILGGGALVVPSLLARLASHVEVQDSFLAGRSSWLLRTMQRGSAPSDASRELSSSAPPPASRASRTAAEAPPPEEAWMREATEIYRRREQARMREAVARQARQLQQASPDGAAPEEARSGGPEAEVPAETDRFIDLTIYRGHLYQGDAPAPADRVDDLEPLPPEEGCTLEVAIRRERTGIAAGAEAPRVRNPRKHEESLTIYARVRSLDPEILEFEDGLLDFEWPYDADSGTALFRFTPHKPAGRDDARASIEVRLYSAELELLELVEIRDITVGEAPTGALRTLAWPEARPSDPTTGPRRWPHAFAIHVFAVPGGYSFEVLRRDGERPLPPVALGRTIPSGELEELLRRVRDFWTGLVVGVLATQRQLTLASYGKILDKMAGLGHDGWRLLFGNRRGAMAGSSEALGELLTGLGERGSIVQVSYAAGAEGFVFPWSVLRPPLARDETPDPEAFWGLRYQIEQLRAGPRSNRLDDEPVAVATVIDPDFEQSGEHAEHLRAIGAEHAEHVALLAAIGDREDLFEALEQPRAAHLYYFFCHGYAPGRRPAMARDALAALRERSGRWPRARRNARPGTPG